MSWQMSYASVLLLLATALAGCAGKRTVPAGWPDVPTPCEPTHAVLGKDCTPLPQVIPTSVRVEAGLTSAPGGLRLQVYRLVPSHPKAEIVFIHGLFGHASDFRMQFVHPPADVIVTALDRAGYVRSSSTAKEPSLALHARSLEGILRRNPELPVILVGHSYGGAIALEAALRYPERVRGMVLVSAIVDPAQAKPFFFQRWLEARPLAGLIPRRLDASNREVLRLQKDLQSLSRRLPGLRVPVVALHGEDDDVVSPSNLDYLSERLAAGGHGERVVTKRLPELGHFIPDRNPDRLHAGLKKILQSVEALAR